MKKSPKVLVPFTEAEWHFVKTNFMSNDVDLLEQVFGLLSMWEGRTGSDTPIFVQMSKLVVQAILYDLRHCASDLDRSNESNLVSICGLSLTRFINYVNEIAQPKVGFLLSIANAVKEFGIPERIVHLRQNIVHGEMPPLFELREAIQFCREWLWEMNWKYSMAVAICDPTILLTPTTSAQDAGPDLEQLFSQFWTFSSKKTNDKSEKAAIQRKTKAFVDTLNDLMADKLDDILVSFSNALVLSKTAMKLVQVHLQIDDFEGKKSEWTVSEPLFNVWRPIIDMFSRGRYGVLISHLSDVICDEIRPRDDRLQIVAWFRCILDKIKLTDTCLLVKDLNATAHNVINAGKFFTIDDFNKCLELFGEESERKSFYRRMWKLKSLTESSGDNVQQTNNDENQTVPGILTLESLKNALDKRKGLKRPTTENPTPTSWCLKQLNCPLGLQPEQTAETLFLRI